MRIKVCDLGMYDFDGDIDSVVNLLRDLQNKYPGRKLGIDAYMSFAKGSYDSTDGPIFEVFYIE